MTSRPALTRFVLLLTALLPFAALAAGPKSAPKGPAPVEGVDYVVIDGGQPYRAAKGRIEVVEAFGYTCPACARFEPLIAKWKAGLPGDVTFTPLAAPLGSQWIPYARAYFAARSMGIADRTHEAVFRALHVDGTLPRSQPTPGEIASFYAGHGANAERFVAAMASPAIEAELTRVREFMVRSGIEHTPTLVVNGKYRVLSSNPADMLRISEHLVARERAAKRR